MRKLTNVYIEVTSRNVNDLMKLINRYDLKPNTYVFFNYECITSSVRTFVIPKNRKKVKLSVLKHLVSTIPTREEIISLKRQIGGYKTNYDKAVKHSLSKEYELELLRAENDNLKELLKVYREDESNLLDSLRQSNNINAILQQENEQLKNKKWWQIWK